MSTSRSISDGDLTRTEKKNSSPEYFKEDIERNAFFTLPRWMSMRKKKNSIKYIKVDVPFKSESFNLNQHQQRDLKNEKSSSFISRLFRSSSHYSKNSQKRNQSQWISTSTTDVRRSSLHHSFDHQEFFGDFNPAVCGIKNHGNTCFMNAVIQCLSNTDILAEYFVMDHYRMDLLRRNKSHSKRYGTRGDVPQQLSALLKSLWSCQSNTGISTKFKNVVSKYGHQYEGNDQHDAQEFLLWLLDKVHEDLNTAPKEKYKKIKGNMGRSDEDIAAETLANHLRCNSSFIQDLFQGQFRSSVCCSGCGRFSNTFDPYLCVSLPVPNSHTLPIYLSIIFLDEPLKQVNVGVLVDSQATIKELCDKLHSSFGASKDNLLLLQMKDGEFRETFSSTGLVSEIVEMQGVFAIETPLKKKKTDAVCEEVTLIIVNRLMKEAEYEMFWRPFVLTVDRDISYNELKKDISNSMGHLFESNFELPENCFSISVTNDELVQEFLCSSVDMPLYMPAIERALLLCSGGTPHLKLTIEWKADALKILPTDLHFIEEHSSVPTLLNSKKSDDVTLYECFDLYFNEERLGVEDAWMCPHCRNRLPCIKSLGLWTIPDVLIVHLKRFRQFSSEREKITTFVEFPSVGLDMAPYVSSRNSSIQPIQNHSLSSLALWSSWRRSRLRPYQKWEDNTYELYAVCNHLGGMQGGHYTAYCRNPINSNWYLFDDNKVQEVPEKDVVSKDAYILFYQRNSLGSQSCASSSSSGYSSESSAGSIGAEHWACHMFPFEREATSSSKSQDNLYDFGKTSSLDRRSSLSNRHFDRRKNYSTMVHHSQSRLSSPTTNVAEEKENTSPEVEEVPPPPPLVKHYWTVTSV